MMKKDDCLFCMIADGKIPCHKVWEDEQHLAFLTIFPNTDGFTVVITKEHHPSYAFQNDDKVLSDLVLATKKVAKLLDKAFEDVGRCGMFFEGFGVDHLHSKLYPMHGTGNMAEWEAIESKLQNKNEKPPFFDRYPGYLSSRDGERADDTKLAKLAEKIKGV